jgi:hypothetical protein
VLLLFAICAACLAQNDSRVPPEVKFKSGYINTVPKPANFTSAMLWGIAIADTRVLGFDKAQVEIAETRLSCRVDGKDIVINDDRGEVRGGLYRRIPWFGTNTHTPFPLTYSQDHRAVVLRVGEQPGRVWHFWASSPRMTLPPGHLENCRVMVRARISSGALLQVGMDYWRNSTVGYEAGGNNHEAGASDWYFSSPDWQEATFTDVHPR